MTTIALLITLMTVMTVIVGSAIYWWAECQHARNQLFDRDLLETSTPLTTEEQMTVNLNRLANELCDIEDGKTDLTVAQIKDVLAALGERWRSLPTEQASAEFAAIVARAGLKSK